jgi:ABC-type uncharacterized transport system fused permease/ATPase subunit
MPHRNTLSHRKSKVNRKVGGNQTSFKLLELPKELVIEIARILFGYDNGRTNISRLSQVSYYLYTICSLDFFWNYESYYLKYRDFTDRKPIQRLLINSLPCTPDRIYKHSSRIQQILNGTRKNQLFQERNTKILKEHLTKQKIYFANKVEQSTFPLLDIIAMSCLFISHFFWILNISGIVPIHNIVLFPPLVAACIICVYIAFVVLVYDWAMPIKGNTLWPESRYCPSFLFQHAFRYLQSHRPNAYGKKFWGIFSEITRKISCCWTCNISNNVYSNAFWILQSTNRRNAFNAFNKCIYCFGDVLLCNLANQKGVIRIFFDSYFFKEYENCNVIAGLMVYSLWIVFLLLFGLNLDNFIEISDNQLFSFAALPCCLYLMVYVYLVVTKLIGWRKRSLELICREWLQANVFTLVLIYQAFLYFMCLKGMFFGDNAVTCIRLSFVVCSFVATLLIAGILCYLVDIYICVINKIFRNYLVLWFINFLPIFQVTIFELPFLHLSSFVCVCE